MTILIYIVIAGGVIKLIAVFAKKTEDLDNLIEHPEKQNVKK
jgi:hypothetical protein